ncbi:MAG TPA: isoprenylcysteine carboxylmethyltransferase family protein [Gammaproteobacteria bacterium]|nr:isoprenylcysteine carboxylmethyltransferase family protein [Gammaproteobacteria bacterium]
MTDEDKRGPGVRVPPPLLALAVIGAAWAADRVLPLPVGDGNWLRWSGFAVIALAFGLALFTLLHFFVARTHVEPWRPTSVIIRHGIFRFSRNPIYLAFCVATLGTGLVLNSWWGIAAVPLLGYLLHCFAIRREEAYLERKFGEVYVSYRREVRRWL